MTLQSNNNGYLFSKNANLWLTRGESCGIIIDVAGNARRATMESAAVAHLVERHLAKVEVASSSLVGRSIGVVFITPLYGDVAKW